MVVNGYTSEPLLVISGVPHGSVLGPLLFILYVNALCDRSFSNDCEFVMYADDIVLYSVSDLRKAGLTFRMIFPK